LHEKASRYSAWQSGQRKDAAVQVAAHLLVDEGAPEAVATLEALLPLPLDLVVVSLDEAVQGCGARVSSAVDARRKALCGQEKPRAFRSVDGLSTSVEAFGREVKSMLGLAGAGPWLCSARGWRLQAGRRLSQPGLRELHTPPIPSPHLIQRMPPSPVSCPPSWERCSRRAPLTLSQPPHDNGTTKQPPTLVRRRSVVVRRIQALYYQ